MIRTALLAASLAVPSLAHAETITIEIDTRRGVIEMLDGVIEPDGSGWRIREGTFLIENGRIVSTGSRDYFGSRTELSARERDRMLDALRSCWSVDSSSGAMNVTVTVGFDMTRDGHVIESSLRLVEASARSDEAVDSAYRSARHAILRCQDRFELSPRRYDAWKSVTLTFDPVEMLRR